jgi:hypothetical protein
MHSDACAGSTPIPVGLGGDGGAAGASVLAEAYAFRQLMAHLQQRTDVQNIDVMNLAGFCRNCLAKWYSAGLAAARHTPPDHEGACAVVYGMPYAQWKKSHQKKATEEQLALFNSTKPLHAQHPKPASQPPAPTAAAPAPPQAAAAAAEATPAPAHPAFPARKSAFPMVDVDLALDTVLRHCEVLPAESLSLAAAAGESDDGGAAGAPPREMAAGRVLRADVQAAEPLPPFAASILDGYAVRAADLQSAPTELQVVGRLTAGSAPTFELGVGEAAYITTGAQLPAGADAVIGVEQSEVLERRRPPDGGSAAAAAAGVGGEGAEVRVRLHRAVTKPGQDVRAVGVDIAAGAGVLQAPQLIGAVELGLAAAVGVTSVQVARKPVIGVLSTGDELLPAGAPLQPGKIRDCNRSTLLSWATAQAGRPTVLDLGACPDDEAGAAAVAAVLTEIYLCGVCSCQEILRRNGRGQGCAAR